MTLIPGDGAVTNEALVYKLLPIIDIVRGGNRSVDSFFHNHDHLLLMLMVGLSYLNLMSNSSKEVSFLSFLM